PVELTGDRLAGHGGDPLRAAGELHFRIRVSVPSDPVQAINQKPDRLAVLAVVPQQRLPEPLVPRHLPPIPPAQALQSGRLRVGPDRTQEPAQRLQPIRADWEVDLAVYGRCHVHEAVAELTATTLPPRKRGERLLLVAAEVVDGGAGERRQPLDQGRPH